MRPSRIGSAVVVFPTALCCGVWAGGTAVLGTPRLDNDTPDTDILDLVLDLVVRGLPGVPPESGDVLLTIGGTLLKP